MQSHTTTAEMKRYYLYNFVVNTVNFGGNFTMVYFYFHGFSIVALVSVILVYGLTCLVILKPVGILVERVGPQITFRLHVLSEIAKYIALLFIFVFPEHQFLFFVLVQFFNAFNVMLSRIPLTAYFSAYGENSERGSQIGLTNNLQILATVLVPVLAGALIQRTGLILIMTITMLVNVAAIFMLKFDARVKVQNPVRFRELFKSMPKPFTRAFFIGNLPYPFMADLASIYIAIVFQSFTVLGIFVGLRMAVTALLNYSVGRMTDAHKAHRFFFWGVLISSIFWLILPFVHHAWSIVILQFTVGLAGLVTPIPFEGAYHNLAKESGRPLEFSVWREVSTQAGLVIGCIITILVLRFGLVSNWQMLLPLGSISALALLFALPYIKVRKNQ